MSPADPAFGQEPEEHWGVLGEADKATPVKPERGNYAEFYRLLGEALREGTEPPVDPSDAVTVLDIIRHAHQVQRGYASHLVSRADLTAHHLAPGPRDQLAIHNPGEGWVSLPHLIDALATEFAELGGQLVTGAGRCPVEAERENGRVSGVRSENGRSWHGDAVVVACGSDTPAVVAELGVYIPDGSVPSMLVIAEPARAEARSVLNTPRVAMRPNPGETFAIDHSWYEDRIVEHEDGTWSIDEATVNELVGEASALLDDAEPLIPASWKLGRKPIPGDGQPVFGELATVPGCHVAFTHSGATLGLIAGELTTHEVLTGDRHPLLAEFRPERYSPTHRGEV
ncbi:NAD(P)/FAD-dependent oxidoreductase [Streptomyces violaceusniger]|uniref:FAD dependent oxidoreductase domain-containing protein n=1 Tax=Streptomyces violaceusniger TaxID=68280 RepID=A0A4D4KKU1_STRVO|nr:hypothetical protein SVIO_003840 [Streptomyces violaceusniger]